jgi:cobaltochelatase CobS
MSNQQTQPTMPNAIALPVASFFPEAGNAKIFGYNPDHAFQSYVPKAEPGYVHRREFVREYVSWHNSPGESGLMIVGPTGSGKTTAIHAINHSLNIPTILVSCHRDMSLIELKGTMQFVTDPVSQQSITKFVYGPVAMAFKYGMTLILDENNLLDPGVNAGLNETVRGNTLFIEATGEMIQRHPMFRIIATGNDWGRGDGEIRNAGINQQNAAYLNRWWKFEMGYPTEDVEKKILAMKKPDLPEQLRDGMVSIANQIRPTIRGVGKDDRAANMDIDFSTRTLIDWADKTLRFHKAPNAVQYGLEIVLLRSCNKVERETIERACKDTLGDAYCSA